MKYRLSLLFISLLVAGITTGATCTSAPVISSPVATPDATGQQVTFTWTSDVIANSRAAYGYPNAGIFTAVADNRGVKSHSITVTGLLPGRTYGWGIISTAVSDGVPCDYHYITAYGGGDNGNSFTTSTAPAGTFDYYLSPVGPQHVTQGYALHFKLMVGNLVGSTGNKSVKVVLSGLPDFTSITWIQSAILGGPDVVSSTRITNDTLTWYEFQDEEIKILTNVGGATTPGTYTITMTGSGSGLPTHTASFPITVDAAASPFGITFPFGTPSSYPAIPDLATYKASAAKYGIFNCAQDTDVSPRTIRPNDNANLTPVSTAFQRGAWYYDGVRVFYNVQNLLKASINWEQCRQNVRAVYRDDYVIPNKGAIPVFLQFPQGAYIDYIKGNGATEALTFINYIDAHTYGVANGGLVDVNYLQRETAYSLKNDIYANKLGQNNVRYGQSTNFWLAYHLDHVLGHVDQICLSQNASYFENFMAGLQADALIDYYTDVSPDPRIPSAIKCLADYLYTNQWNLINFDPGSFPYDSWRATGNIGSATGSSMVSLNMLIAPMYAWLFKMTGLSQYQIVGDVIWDHGVLFDGPLAGGLDNNLGSGNGYPNCNCGKQYSQQYMWGPSYVDWRSSPGSGTTASKSSSPEAPYGPSARMH